jgi:hypothetical protein
MGALAGIASTVTTRARAVIAEVNRLSWKEKVFIVSWRSLSISIEKLCAPKTKNGPGISRPVKR